MNFSSGLTPPKPVFAPIRSIVILIKVILAHSLIHSFTHSLTHSFTHSLFHSFTRFFNHRLDFDMKCYYTVNLENEDVFQHFRYYYYLYQCEITNKPTQRGWANSKNTYIQVLLNMISEKLQLLLSTVTPETSVNSMISFKNNVILTDNQYICINQNNIGVILPFYGSSSFVTDINRINTNGVQTQIKEFFNTIQMVNSALATTAASTPGVGEGENMSQSQNISTIMTMYEELKEKKQWLLHLK